MAAMTFLPLQAATRMDQDMQFRVRYWGATGTLARTLLPGEITDKLAAAIRHLLDDQVLIEIVRSRADVPTIRRYLESSLPVQLRSSYLGNSTCIEIETPGELIVVDCGTGFRDLGYDLERRWSAPGYAGNRQADILITHPHIDHILAIPFVGSFYDPRNHFTIWAPQSVLDSLDAIFRDRSPLAKVYVPTGYSEMSGIKQLRAIRPGDDFSIGQTRVSAYALNHPGGCVAYRLDRNGRRVVVATDHEHEEIPDRGLAAFARNADLLYADAQYLAEEYSGQVAIGAGAARSHVGWGHSTIDAAVATAVEAEVRTLHLGHHEPRRTDLELHGIECVAQRLLRDRLIAAGKHADACHVQLAHEDLISQV
jgi:phosphoribosyl 1,2-cyclic phosphodiesterase